jgi:hypothetical protein
MKNSLSLIYSAHSLEVRFLFISISIPHWCSELPMLKMGPTLENIIHYSRLSCENHPADSTGVVGMVSSCFHLFQRCLLRWTNP